MIVWSPTINENKFIGELTTDNALGGASTKIFLPIAAKLIANNDIKHIVNTNRYPNVWNIDAQNALRLVVLRDKKFFITQPFRKKIPIENAEPIIHPTNKLYIQYAAIANTTIPDSNIITAIIMIFFNIGSFNIGFFLVPIVIRNPIFLIFLINIFSIIILGRIFMLLCVLDTFMNYPVFNCITFLLKKTNLCLF